MSFSNIIVWVLLPCVVLWVRMASFSVLTIVELPRATENDLKKMRKASMTALIIIVLFSLGNFLMFFSSSSGMNNAMAMTGIIFAGISDYKAELIKRRCRDAIIRK